MSIKTKKILALICWFAFIVIWNSLQTYHIVEFNDIFNKVVDAVIVCAGALIFMWIINPGLLKNNKE